MPGPARTGAPGGADGPILWAGWGPVWRELVCRPHPGGVQTGGAGGAGSGAGKGQAGRGRSVRHWARGAGNVRQGGRGFPGPPRRLRRGRPHPGRAGSAGRALHRFGLPGLGHCHG